MALGKVSAGYDGMSYENMYIHVVEQMDNSDNTNLHLHCHCNHLFMLIL